MQIYIKIMLKVTKWYTGFNEMVKVFINVSLSGSIETDNWWTCKWITEYWNLYSVNTT